MSKILSVLFITLASLIPASQATAHSLEILTSQAQAQYLMNQAQFLAQQGVSQENILKVFKQSLAQESLNTEKAQAPRSYLIVTAGCVVGILIGGGVVYYFMNKINNEHQATINRLNGENGVLGQTVQDITAQNQGLNGHNQILQATVQDNNINIQDLTERLLALQNQYDELSNDASIPQPRYTALARINKFLEHENTDLKAQIETLRNEKIVDDFLE